MVLLSLYLGIFGNSAATTITKLGQKVDHFVRSPEDISPSTGTGDSRRVNNHVTLTNSRISTSRRGFKSMVRPKANVTLTFKSLENFSSIVSLFNFPTYLHKCIILYHLSLFLSKFSFTNNSQDSRGSRRFSE